MGARIDERLDYPGFGPGYVGGACRLRVYETAGLLPVAVVTELDDNPGPSVTSAAEQVHGAVAARLGLPAGAFTHVEHYPPRGDGRTRNGSEYDLVTVEDGEASWVHLPADRVEALLGELP